MCIVKERNHGSAGSGPPAAPLLRPRSHSSADLTSQGSSSALPSASSTGVGLAAGAQRAPPRGSQLAGPTAAGFSDNSTDPALDFDLPNGHPAGAEDQDSEKVADADKRWQRPTYRLPGSEMLPVSATYAPYGGPGGGRTWSQDSQGDSGNRAFLAELQMEMAARGSLEGARPSRSGFMTPPPPPPPRTPPLGAMYPSTGSIERQGSFQVCLLSCLLSRVHSHLQCQCGLCIVFLPFCAFQGQNPMTLIRVALGLEPP